ncbi:MAG: MFS transporter [Pseudomonadota bacterium]|nr:MFS transporter [Pseudomonadota bacterium]
MASRVALSLEPREHIVVWLIGVAHLVSHFYHLVLPPLFGLIISDLNITYTQIGLVMTLYFASTAIVQIPIGILVDRIGARTVLTIGLFLMGTAVLLAGLVPNYTVLLLAFLIAGIGNAVFHPADFSILSKSVRKSHHGRAFAIHTFGGSIGYAAAPVVILPLGAVIGWQGALVFAGMLGLFAGLTILFFGSSFQDNTTENKLEELKTKGQKKEGDWRIMLTRPMLLFFLFYAATSASATGMTGFSIYALPLVYNVTPETAGIVLTCFLTAAILGSLPGGWLADWADREELVLVFCFFVSVICLVSIGAGILNLWFIFAVALLSGFIRGLYNASRDILVRRASPDSSVGTTFGFVTLGYTLGQGGTPILYGWLMDQNYGSGVFYLSAGAALIALSIVLVPGQGQKQR